MRSMLSICCGLDVHKNTVTACLLQTGARGEATKETRTFSTTTKGLLELSDWLVANRCRHVAMESTGVYWKPVYNILEGVCEEVSLVNAQHVKNVPGRKTDAGDAEWIAELLAHGLLQPSFVPPQEIRDLRDLTRYRQKLLAQRADQCNRIQKMLEGSNIKLAGVISDILGVSGREMLEALAEGETDVTRMADMARGAMRPKIPQLKEALTGKISPTQRWLLKEQLEHVSQLDERIARLAEKIEELCLPFAEEIEKLSEIPGVGIRIAQIIVAEIGVDMRQFPSARHLASWAGMCPGNRESAGKRQSGKRRKGSRWLRAALAEAGWAVARTHDNYLAAQYTNIARRRGKKRACVAVGHSILVIAHHVLSQPDIRYQDLGSDYFTVKDKHQLAQQLIRRLAKLGYTATVQWNVV